MKLKMNKKVEKELITQLENIQEKCSERLQDLESIEYNLEKVDYFIRIFQGAYKINISFEDGLYYGGYSYVTTGVSVDVEKDKITKTYCHRQKSNNSDFTITVKLDKLSDMNKSIMKRLILENCNKKFIRIDDLEEFSIITFKVGIDVYSKNKNNLN